MEGEYAGGCDSPVVRAIIYGVVIVALLLVLYLAWSAYGAQGYSVGGMNPAGLPEYQEWFGPKRRHQGYSVGGMNPAGLPEYQEWFGPKRRHQGYSVGGMNPAGLPEG